MTGISTGPKLFLPGLAPLYRHIVPLSWLVIRCTVGLILFYHGTKKIGHVDGVTANMIKNSLSPPVLIAYVVILTETVGARRDWLLHPLRCGGVRDRSRRHHLPCAVA